MANPVVPKKSSVAAKVPLSTDLLIGELAVNLTDRILYTKDSAGNVITLGGGGSSFSDTLFQITDNADPTKIAKFEVSGITTGTTQTYTLPNVSATLAHTGNVSQSFAGSVSFNNAAGYFGMSTANSNSTLGGGATLSGNTKTVLIGSAGASGSTTNISLGSAVAGATNTITMYAVPSLPSQTAAYVFAAPSGAAGTPSFRALVSSDLPTYTGTLTSGQVTTALGFTPYNSTNPNGYISGITSGMVTTALGYTPYNSTNPSGYITGISSSMVTTALGYTPYNSTNPNGYITSSGSISGSAGSVSGLTLTSSANGINPDSVTQNQIGYNTSVSLFGQSDGGLYSSAYSSAWIHQIYGDFRSGQIAIRGKNNGTWQAWRTVLDSGNYTNYAPTLTGGGASGTWGINVTGSAGSVAWSNVSGRPTTVSSFTNDSGYITSSALSPYQLASTAITTSNIGSQSVNYATSAGSANTATSSSNANGVNITGYGAGNGTYYQTSGTFAGYSGWAGYWVSNHGDGATYYNQTIIMPFWSAPQYSRLEGGVSKGPYTFITTENQTSYAPSLTGAGASGTWGINITGSANALNSANSYSVVNLTASGAITSNSDETLKTNWRPVADDFVSKLAGVKSGVYDRVDCKMTQAGVSAQSLRDLLPEAVSADDHGILSVAYGNAALVSAVELAKEILALREEIAALKAAQ